MNRDLNNHLTPNSFYYDLSLTFKLIKYISLRYLKVSNNHFVIDKYRIGGKIYIKHDIKSRRREKVIFYSLNTIDFSRLTITDLFLRTF